MLAYVFWHWRRPEVDAAIYVARLAAFHEALRRSKPEGFEFSAAFRAGAAPWVPADESYEDWYVTHGSYALDPLNDGAVTGDCKAPHDASARSAAGGTAGLYRLRFGTADVREATTARWFAKPAGMSYEDLYSHLEALAASPGVGVWGRQMTLGPTTEFCVLGASDLDLPYEWSPLTRPLERLWPTARGLPQETMSLG